MSATHSHDVRVPLPVLIGVGALLVGVFIYATVAKATGVGRMATPEIVAAETLVVRFDDEADGGIGVYRSENGALILKYDTDASGFVRTALRALALDRRRAGVGSQPPFELIRTVRGDLVLRDASTGSSVRLAAFGAGNAESFEPIFDAAGAQT